MLLVTGYGSIGSLVVDKLLKFHSDILIVDKDEKAVYQALIKFRYNNRVKCIVSDISIKDDLKKIFLFNNITHIVHTAAMKHVTFCEVNPLLATINNIIGINNLLELATENNVKKIINVSTDKSANPSNVMGATKFIAERTILQYDNNTNMRCQNVRLGNVLGSNGSLIPTIVKIVNNNGLLDLTDLRATRFFITPNDVSGFIVDVLLSDYVGSVIIKKIKSATLETMVNATLQLINRRDYSNIKVVGLRRGEKLHEHLYSSAESPHLIDYGNYWSIDYSKNKGKHCIVDSSQFCVSEDEFLKVLEGLDANYIT